MIIKRLTLILLIGLGCDQYPMDIQTVQSAQNIIDLSLDSGNCLYQADQNVKECIATCDISVAPSQLYFRWQACEDQCQGIKHVDKAVCFAQAGNVIAADNEACIEQSFEVSHACWTTYELEGCVMVADCYPEAAECTAASVEYQSIECL